MVGKVQIPLPQQLIDSGFLKTGKDKDRSGIDKKQELGDPFKGLNIDQFGLSEDARNKVIWARAQFEVNYQVLKSVNSSQGTETSEETFSFKASFEFLQKASGQDPQAIPGNPPAGSSIPGMPTDAAPTGEAGQTSSAQDALSQLQEYFSPERTAQRILDVATSFFAVSETGQDAGNTVEGRRKFADFIGGAIDEGFRQARGLLGALPKEVDAGVDTTHSLVFAGLEDFVNNGISPEKTASNGVMEKIAAYRQEGSRNMEQVKKAYAPAPAGYNAKGESKETPAAAPTISKTG